jgi:hypothetical protein
MRHPTVETLIAHIEGDPASSRGTGIENHLKTCDACRRKTAEFRDLLGLLEADRADEPPAESLDWALDLFQPVRGFGEGSRGPLGRIARRVFDSLEHAAPAGVRAGAGALARQLLYRTEGVDIDLRIEPTDEEHISLVGQVLSDSPTAIQARSVVLASSTGASYDTLTNPVGEFSFDSVPKNTYHLLVDLPDGEVTLFCVHRNTVFE